MNGGSDYKWDKLCNSKQIGIERHLEFQRKEFKEIVPKETNSILQKEGLKKKNGLSK